MEGAGQLITYSTINPLDSSRPIDASMLIDVRPLWRATYAMM